MINVVGILNGKSFLSKFLVSLNKQMLSPICLVFFQKNIWTKSSNNKLVKFTNQATLVCKQFHGKSTKLMLENHIPMTN